MGDGVKAHVGLSGDVAEDVADGPVELRVHGVGGDDPHTVVGLPYPEDATPVWATAGGRRAVFRRRRDLRTQVFSWGELTSGSRWFALWTLLLPFTLANVAGWAVPPMSRRRSAQAAAALVHLSGILLSTATGLWLALAGVIRLSVPGGLLAAGAAMIALVAIATCVSGRFERFRLPSWSAAPPSRRGIDPDTDLGDPQFFDNGTAQKRRWWLHVVAVALVAAAVFITVLRDADRDDVLRRLGWMIVAVSTADLALVVALGALAFRRVTGAASWRWSAPAMCSGAALLLTTGVTSAVLAAAAGGPAGLPPGPAFLLLDVYALAAGASLAVLLVVAIVVLLCRSPAEKTDAGVPPQEQVLVSPKARRAARLAQLVRHVDLPATALVATFAVGGLAIIVIRCLTGSPATWQPQGNVLTRSSLAFLALFVGFIVRDVGRNALDVQARRRVGQLWDVLTFWPRLFHPFAVRPYAERAVPELQEYLRTGGTTGPPRRWVVTAHSQGSVLAYAALRSRSSGTDQQGDGAPFPAVDLITFGSPLLSLFSKAFPRYFRRQDFVELAPALAAGDGSWTNVFRATDQVGREVFTARWDARDRADVGLEDPTRRHPVPDPLSPDAEQDLPTDGRVWGHSGYRRTQPFKDVVYPRLGRVRKE